MLLNPSQWAVLHAVLDRLIPGDDFPSAWEAGGGDYVLRLLGTDLKAAAADFAAGLDAIDAEARAGFGCCFIELSTDQQDATLGAIEAAKTLTPWPAPPAAFFTRLVHLAAEGYYADPSNGGNRDAVSWKMLGYDAKGQAEGPIQRS